MKQKIISLIIILFSIICGIITKDYVLGTLVLMCGFNNFLGIDPDYDAVNKPMFLDNLKDVKEYCNDIVCFYSDNDPYVKFETEKSFAGAISNELNNGGHINAESGYTKFEEKLRVL